jgi:nucleoside-diphosphate-sugar epimerase
VQSCGESVNKNTILIVFGTRPEVIKMCLLYIELKKRADVFNVILCATGQHREMLDSVLQAFEVVPDYDLSILPAQQITVGDICDPEIFADLDGIDCIFHCAAVTKSSERLSQTFGKGTSKFDSRVFAQFARSAMMGNDIILHTDGQSIGNYCEISDTVSALHVIAEKGAANEVYNISSETMTIKEMAELVADLYGTKVIIDKSQNTGAYAAPQSYTLNTDKLRGLGWNPIKTLKDAYKEMIQGWRTTAGRP